MDTVIIIIADSIWTPSSSSSPTAYRHRHHHHRRHREEREERGSRVSTRFSLGVENEREGCHGMERTNLFRETKSSRANGSRGKKLPPPSVQLTTSKTKKTRNRSGDWPITFEDSISITIPWRNSAPVQSPHNSRKILHVTRTTSDFNTENSTNCHTTTEYKYHVLRARTTRYRQHCLTCSAMCSAPIYTSVSSEPPQTLGGILQYTIIYHILCCFCRNTSSESKPSSEHLHHLGGGTKCAQTLAKSWRKRGYVGGL